MSNGSGVLVGDLDLVAYMEKVKEPALCGPGEEKSEGRCNRWLQLPKWNHVYYIAPFPNKSWCIAKRVEDSSHKSHQEKFQLNGRNFFS